MKLNLIYILSVLIMLSTVACQQDKKGGSANSNAAKTQTAAKTSKAKGSTMKVDPRFPTEPQVNLGDLKYEDTADGKRLALYNGKPFTGVALMKLANGKPYTSETFIDGFKNGPYKIWHGNGNLYQEGTTVNGTSDGLYQEYYEGGELKYEYHYKNGKKINAWKSWYENGQMWTKRDFNYDQLHGKVLVWDTDGTLTKEYTYQNGNLIDKQLYFEEE